MNKPATLVFTDEASFTLAKGIIWVPLAIIAFGFGLALPSRPAPAKPFNSPLQFLPIQVILRWHTPFPYQVVVKNALAGWCDAIERNV